MRPPDGPIESCPCLAILGPTASGKSRFALEVALRFGGEIVSCDSMAVYRGMDIGTDKPSWENRARIPHHCLDVAEPGTYFSAGAFREAALSAIREISARGRLCIIVGGTGLYYRALTQGLVDLPPRNEPLRHRLQERAAHKGAESLHRLLTKLDPASASRIPSADTLRTIRALEVRILTGEPLSRVIEAQPFRRMGPEGMLRVGITGPRDLLYAKIERRVDAMVGGGLLEEVERLLRAGLLKGPARKAIGYGELADHLEGRCSLGEAVERVKLRSRHLAKRQITWFGKEMGLQWYSIGKEAWSNDAIQFIQRWHEKAQPNP